MYKVKFRKYSIIRSHHEQMCLTKLHIDIYFSCDCQKHAQWEKYFLKHSIIKYICSWHNKLILCYVIVLQKCCFSVFIVIVAIFGKILSQLFLIDFRNHYVWYTMFLILGNTFLESFKNASKIFQFCEIFSEQNHRDFSRILIAGFHSWLAWRQWNLHLHNLGIISSFSDWLSRPNMETQLLREN